MRRWCCREPGRRLPCDLSAAWPHPTIPPHPARSGSDLLRIEQSRGVHQALGAVHVADRVIERIDALSGTLLPEGVHVRITRNYGVTADDKVNELLEGLAVAIVIVIATVDGEVVKEIRSAVRMLH